MSKSDSASAGATLDLPERDEILDLLEDGIDEAHHKVTNGRVYNPENEKVRIKYMRALAYLAKVHNQIQNDRDLEELSERLERLEERESIDP